jgi:hypothetical protein
MGKECLSVPHLSVYPHIPSSKLLKVGTEDLCLKLMGEFHFINYCFALNRRKFVFLRKAYAIREKKLMNDIKCKSHCELQLLIETLFYMLYI